MSDLSLQSRRLLADQINAFQESLEYLQTKWGEVWNTERLLQEFDVIEVAVSFVLVRRKADNVRGVLLFQQRPRYYFNFESI